MKRLLMAAFLCISILYAGCSSDGPTGTDEPRNDPIATATIGPEGGTMATDDFILDVPAGAFDSSNELNLYVEAEQLPYSDNAVSGLFRLDGIPNIFAEPLRMALRYEGTLSETSYGAIGQELFIRTLGDTATAYVLFEAADSSGFLVFELSMPPEARSAPGLLAGAAFLPEELKATALTDLHNHTSTAGHFKVIAPKNKATKEQMEDVADRFEGAYDTYGNNGFDYGNRGHWPIEVFMAPLQGSYGSYAVSLLAKGFGYVMLSTGLLNDPNELSITVGHEFLHLIQDLYDPRSWPTKMVDFGPKYWLDEATATYSEEFFSNNPATYVPVTFTGYRSEPFKGIHKQGSGAGDHGYGMAALIKYLTGKFQSSTVLNYYTDISNDKHPVETIISRSNGSTDWLGDFLREYVRGNVYGVDAGYFNSDVHPNLVFKIDAADDTLKKWFDYYPQMGGQLHRVELEYPGIAADQDISFTLRGPYDEKTEVSILKYKGTGSMELIDYSTTGVVVDDISGLTAGGYDLYALVTNRNTAPPYNASTGIGLNIRLQGGFNPAGCAIILRNIDASFETRHLSDSTSVSSGTHGTGFPKEQGATVEFTGTTLTQLHDHVGTDGNHYVGSMVVTFDAAFNNVATFSATATISKDDWTMTSTLSGQNIPLETDGYAKVFKVTGTPTCGRITGMTWTDSTSIHTVTLLPGWTCNDESEIEVWLFSE